MKLVLLDVRLLHVLPDIDKSIQVIEDKSTKCELETPMSFFNPQDVHI